MSELIDIPNFRALLVDDHLMFSQGLGELIRKMGPGCEILCMASIEKARAELDKNEYQFLLCDLMIPGADVKSFILQARKKNPALIIIIISSVLEIVKIKECFGLGINSYISKAVNHYELKMAFEKTWRGDKYISSDISGRLAHSLHTTENSVLTKKELEILRSVAAGNTVEKTAEIFSVSPFTVLAHRRNIMAKLNLHSAAELVKYAFENNLN